MIARLKTWAAVAGAFIVAAFYVFFRGKSAGRAAVEAQEQKARDALREKYDEIDSKPADVGAAYERLRARAHK